METFDDTGDELIMALGETRKDFMECFIIEDGVERRADLEDLFTLLMNRDSRGEMFQYFLRKANYSNIDLAAALAHLPDEMKETVYRNMSIRNRGRLKQQVDDLESRYKKNHSFLREARLYLIDFLGELEKDRLGWYSFLPEQVVWKKTAPEENKAAKPSLLGYLKKKIEEALDSGKLDMIYYTNELTQDDVRTAFQSRLDDLHKIRRLSIEGKYLSAAALLFEKGKIEALKISGEFDGAANEFAWPSFLDNCTALTELYITNSLKSKFELTELPSWIRGASSLRNLSISFSQIALLPDWLGDLQSLTRLSLYSNGKLLTLPDNIGNLKNLDELYIDGSPIKKIPDSVSNLKNLRKLVLSNLLIEKMPDWLGDLQSLTGLFLDNNRRLKTLPGSIGNLKNLVELDISGLPIKSLPDSMANLKYLKGFSLNRSPVKKLPDWLGDLQSMTMLSLNNNCRLKALPGSIGNLNKLVTLDLGYSSIEELPGTIVNCGALESVNVFGTKISSVPGFIKSIKDFKDNTLIEIIPSIGSQGRSISYRCFCNSYYKLARTIIAFNDKARREGLLALEAELEPLAEDFFKQGIRLVVDGTDSEYIRDILQVKLEREHDFYRKKLMEIAKEGILSIQAGDSPILVILSLASIVNIKNNPLDAACAKYLSGEFDAIDNIDFSAAIQPEEEREEIRFIKRALEISETARREGLLALEEHVSHEGIAARDVFEYGLVPVIDGWDSFFIAKLLDNLIANEADPVRKNIAQAKKKAVLEIRAGINPHLLLLLLCAFFDEDITGEIMGIYD